MLEVQKGNTRFIACHPCQDAADADAAFHALAHLLDNAYSMGVEIDRTLAADGRAGWRDDARKASLSVLEQLDHLRAVLHREAVAAGGEAAHAFVHRHLRPETATRLIAAAARAEQRGHERAAQVERERRHEANGAKAWASRQANSSSGKDREQSGSSGSSREGGQRSDGDCPASIHADFTKGPATAPASAHEAAINELEHGSTE